MMFNSSLFANGYYNFIYPPPCLRPVLCGMSTAVLPLASGNPPGFGPFCWGHPGFHRRLPMGDNRLRVRVTNELSLCATPSGWGERQPWMPASIGSTKGQSRWALPAALSGRAGFRPQPPDTCQFLTSSALQSLKHHTTCIYLSFHFYRLCVPYTHY